jgi:hypothetical protein
MACIGRGIRIPIRASFIENCDNSTNWGHTSSAINLRQVEIEPKLITRFFVKVWTLRRIVFGVTERFRPVLR